MDNEYGSAAPVPESERVAFCQDCGRPLTRETARTVGSGVFCEPCLEIRLAAAGGAAAGGAAAGTGWTSVPPVTPGTASGTASSAGTGAAGGTAAGSAGSMPPGVFPALGGDNPSPALAALLGFIPGVGAIYNGQFAKGIAHIVIFAFLSSLGHASDFFGFLAFLWCCYQSYEAYHTAKARREGMPLPDPFGLNDIGERMGMGKGWPGFTGRPGSPANGQPPPAYPGWTGYVPQPPYAQPPYAQQPPYVPPVSPQDPYATGTVPPPVAAYEAPVQPWASAAASGAPPAAEWASTPNLTTPLAPVRASRFPAGAVWLIGLGVLFLVFNIEPDWRFSVNKIVPFFLMGLAVWILVRRLMATGGIDPRDGEGSAYGARLVAGLRAPAVLFTVGVLMALQTFSHDSDVRFYRTWPVLLLVLGAVLLVERSIGARAYLGLVPANPVDPYAVGGSPDNTTINDTNTTGKGY